MSNGYWGQSLQKGAASGAYLRDYRHANKIFGTSSFALAPKFKFLFHTVFEINPSVYNPSTTTNFSVLVKTIKLPSFQIKTQEYNQYNRKRIIQTKINYEPVGITFHDDNSNSITKMWRSYYSYYYKDTTNLNVLRGNRGTDVSSGPVSESASKQDGITIGDI